MLKYNWRDTVTTLRTVVKSQKKTKRNISIHPKCSVKKLFEPVLKPLYLKNMLAKLQDLEFMI